jgi:hypothetical protein
MKIKFERTVVTSVGSHDFAEESHDHSHGEGALPWNQ